MQEIYEQLSLPISLPQKCTASVFRVKLSALLETDEVSQIQGFADTRGTLFFEVMRLAKERHPDLLFAENVKGLLNHDNGRTFGTIIRTMDELGYDVEWQVCNSKYWLPQNRERVYIIGHFRGGGCTKRILPLDFDYTEVDELQRFDNSTCLDTRIEGNTRGTYPIDGGGYLKVNGYHKSQENRQ